MLAWCLGMDVCLLVQAEADLWTSKLHDILFQQIPSKDLENKYVLGFFFVTFKNVPFALIFILSLYFFLFFLSP